MKKNHQTPHCITFTSAFQTSTDMQIAELAVFTYIPQVFAEIQTRKLIQQHTLELAIPADGFIYDVWLLRVDISSLSE